ncbi:MAG: SUF system NifU family Fe-S cluster assembly protein [Proteobacteria bacterium]|nr:SUF system NifU family Fe-S cluster assembly protein [Pseudomonadota bacterium]
MNPLVTELYQRTVLDHNKSPRHYGEVLGASHRSLGRNPICGDVVQVYLVWEEGKVKDIGFSAQSCALCKASASIMCELLFGATSDEAEQLAKSFRWMISTGEITIESDAKSLSIVKNFPARAKCVLLPWQTFAGALRRQQDVTTEGGFVDSQSQTLEIIYQSEQVKA